MSYDATFPKTMDMIYRALAGGRTVISGHASPVMRDIKCRRDRGCQLCLARRGQALDTDIESLQDRVYRMRSLYAIADHTRSLLVAIHDGAAFNVGGGYTYGTCCGGAGRSSTSTS
jgi:alanyl-tRNA synthetase